MILILYSEIFLYFASWTDLNTQTTLSKITCTQVDYFTCFLFLMIVQDCEDSWCVECSEHDKCDRCQDAFRLTSSNGCTIRGTLPTEAVLAIFSMSDIIVLLEKAIKNFTLILSELKNSFYICKKLEKALSLE